MLRFLHGGHPVLKRLAAIAVSSFSLCGCTWASAPPPPVYTQPPVPSSTVTTGAKSLPISPVAQQTAEWCWLASAEMIFRYYGVPPVNGISYQCGIMGAVEGPYSPCFQNCAQCVFGSGSDAASARVLQDYPAIVQQYFYPQFHVPQIRSTLLERSLVPSEIQQQINAGNPVELGITVGGPFSGQAGHDVVLIGYTATAPSTFAVIIDDPFPYDLAVGAAQNPYYAIGARAQQPGQYLVDYNAAVRGLQWSASILVSSPG